MAICAALVAFALVGVATAAPAPGDDGRTVTAQATVATLSGGGTGGSTWRIDDAFDSCVDLFTAKGFAVADATLDPGGAPRPDAYDGALMGWVDATIVGGTVTTDGASFAQVTSIINGLDVTSRVDTFTSSSVVRQLVTLTNPTPTPVSTVFTWTNDSGSDVYTNIVGTSSGDTNVGTGDHWVVSDDDGSPSTPDDPVVTYVSSGDGAPSAPTGFTCETYGSGTLGTDASDTYAPEFPVTVPASATRYLLFFSGIDADSSTALARAPQLASVKAGSPFLAGLPADVAANVVNFDLTPAVVPVTPPPPVVVGPTFAG